MLSRWSRPLVKLKICCVLDALLLDYSEASDIWVKSSHRLDLNLLGMISNPKGGMATWLAGG